MEAERSLAARLRELEDREAIRNLIASYGPVADRGDAAAAAALWAEDGLYDVGGFGVYRGQGALEAMLLGKSHQTLIAGGAAHVLSPVEVRLQGDTATAIGYSCVFCWTGERFEVYRVSANRWRLRRGAGGNWQVELRENRLLNGDADALVLLSAAPPDLPAPGE